MDKYAELRAALDAYDDDPASSYARDCFYGNLDSDAIRALLAERDALREVLSQMVDIAERVGGWQAFPQEPINKARAALAQQEQS